MKSFSIIKIKITSVWSEMIYYKSLNIFDFREKICFSLMKETYFKRQATDHKLNDE